MPSRCGRGSPVKAKSHRILEQGLRNKCFLSHCRSKLGLLAVIDARMVSDM